MHWNICAAVNFVCICGVETYEYLHDDDPVDAGSSQGCSFLTKPILPARKTTKYAHFWMHHCIIAHCVTSYFGKRTCNWANFRIQMLLVIYLSLFKQMIVHPFILDAENYVFCEYLPKWAKRWRVPLPTEILPLDVTTKWRFTFPPNVLHKSRGKLQTWHVKRAPFHVQRSTLRPFETPCISSLLKT